MKQTLVIILSFLTLQGAAQQVPFFVGTYTDKGSQGIYFYMFDTKIGTTDLYATTSAENPSFVAKSTDGKMVYAVNEMGDQTAAVSAYAFDGDNLSFVNTLPTNGSYPCHIAVSQRDPLVVVSNYGGGSASVYNLEKDGSLGRMVQHIQHTGSGPNKDRQGASHVHSAFFTPDYKHVYLQDLGSDKITIYAVDKEKGDYVLKEESTLATPAGGGPRHIVFDEKGKNLYVLLEMSAEVVHYRKDGHKWELLTVSSINADDFKGENGAAEIKLSKDGKFLYASNRGEANSIALFSVDKGGELKRVNVYSTKGKGPRNFNLSPDEKYLLVANQYTNNIVIFPRNAATGELSDETREIRVASPVCIAF
ncbi:lactonase family protein [Sphingobacterium psychroaquaticum]|uniref:6-phosphogluconolactonase n=1 Tax=Sphingobacterium psychroaquaticum TaxID=561061 RepID=A0A1X7L7N3_9SPHI|nr:lactonase family protein [Sphingobacterium psychroaquaticum]SMG49474.1 6-phosphogluconolactonase [Sphingobacterium psychroaquaticum]